MALGKRTSNLIGLGIWLAGTLCAVVLVEYNALLGLALALIAGIAMGVVLVMGDSK